MSPSAPRPGEVYAWWLASWQVEVPLQVVAVDDARARFVVLDRLAAGPLKLAHVRAARPLCLTHWYWTGQIVGGELELPLPGKLRPLGALPRRKLRVERNCAGLAELARILGYHCWWRCLPDSTKAAYARASDALVRLPGWTWGERPVALPATTERFLDRSATPGPQASLEAAGGWLDLRLNSSPRPVAGWPGVRALQLHFTAPVSLAALPAAFPQLERLTLVGPGRLVTEREALAALPACQVQAFGEE